MIFHYQNPFGCTMALKSAQPLTKVTSREVKAASSSDWPYQAFSGLCRDCLNFTNCINEFKQFNILWAVNFDMSFLCDFSPPSSYCRLLPNVFRSQNNSDKRKQICDTYLLLVLNVNSWHFTAFQKIIICASSYLQWSINIICSKWNKLALHYTIPLSHTV